LPPRSLGPFLLFVSDMRFLRIYNNEGILQATNELIEGLEHCIEWRYNRIL